MCMLFLSGGQTEGLSMKFFACSHCQLLRCSLFILISSFVTNQGIVFSWAPHALKLLSSRSFGSGEHVVRVLLGSFDMNIRYVVMGRASWCLLPLGAANVTIRSGFPIFGADMMRYCWVGYHHWQIFWEELDGCRLAKPLISYGWETG